MRLGRRMPLSTSAKGWSEIETEETSTCWVTLTRAISSALLLIIATQYTAPKGGDREWPAAQQYQYHELFLKARPRCWTGAVKWLTRNSVLSNAVRRKQLRSAIYSEELSHAQYINVVESKTGRKTKAQITSNRTKQLHKINFKSSSSLKASHSRSSSSCSFV